MTDEVRQESVQNAHDAFLARLRRLGELHGRVRRGGQPSLNVLAKAAGVGSKTTVGEWLKGNRLPQHLPDLLGVVRALHVAAQEQWGEVPGPDRDLLDPDAWHSLHAAVVRDQARATGEAVRAERLGRTWDQHEAQRRLAGLPDRPRPVAAWHPRNLGVHPAISGAPGPVDGDCGFVLPTYVPRDHDRRLRAFLERAARDGDAVFVLVQGESCTGKTRTAYEAVRTCLPEWELAFPKGSESLLALLAAEAVGPRTVLWLDEAQDFLMGERGEEVARQLRRLLERPGPVVVLATMWQDHRRTLVTRPTATATAAAPARDPHPHARALLTLADSVHVSAAFPPDAVARLRTTRDAALATAAHTSRDGTLAQTLAAAPELVAFHETSDTVPACYGKAVVTAAMDARRLGHGPELSDALLRAAAPAYLSEAQRTAAGPDWFAQALAHAGTRVKGVVALLGEVPDAGGMGARPDVRRLADYLDHHGRTARAYVCPGAAFWEAVARGAGSALDLQELADSAYRRGRYAVADDLRRRAAERGYAPAWTEMAYFREDRGCRAEAVELLWKGHAAGDTGALTTLAHWYLEDGNRDAALRLVPEIERTGDPQALLSLAQTPELVGGDAEAERLARAAAALGDAEALTFLGRRRMLGGDGAAAEELFRRAVSAGDPAAAFELARMKLADEGDVAASVAAARQAAELGDFFTMGMMAQLVISIDPAEGRRMARLAADLGGVSPAQTVRLSAWENMVRQQGLAVLADHAERTQGDGAGEAVLRAAADAGDLHVMTWLAHRERQFGDPAEAEALYRAAAEGGYAPALLSLAWQRHEAGDDEEAERLCRTAVDAGEPRAVGALAQLWEKTGDRDGAGRLVLYGLNPDGTPTTPWLPLREGHEPAMGHYAVKGWIEVRRAD